MITNSPVHSELDTTDDVIKESNDEVRADGLLPFNVDVCPSCDNESMSSIAPESSIHVMSSGNSIDYVAAATKRSREQDVVSISTRAIAENRTNKKTKAGDDDEEEADVKLAKMTKACKDILECIGEDPSREGLVKTPQRWAKALLFMCNGYKLTPEDVTNEAVFTENHHEMVVVRNIDIHSLCEHHMLPFTGQVHIGYIPNGKIIGLSKLARIAELYARRLQVQERLTAQIADAIVETVNPLGVAVVIECSHFCMIMRGVQKTGAVTTTSSVRGCFESNPKTRAEFFSIIQR